MNSLEGKTAVITGGASGIGAATVRRFVEEGARVVVAQIATALDEAVERFGSLDCLFNNAGAGGVDGMIEETDTQGIDETISLLLRAVVLGMTRGPGWTESQGFMAAFRQVMGVDD